MTLIYTILAGLSVGVAISLIIANSKIIPVTANRRIIYRACIVAYGVLSLSFILHTALTSGFYNGHLLNVCMAEGGKPPCFWVDASLFVILSAAFTLLLLTLIYRSSITNPRHKTLALIPAAALFIAAGVYAESYHENYQYQIIPAVTKCWTPTAEQVKANTKIVVSVSFNKDRSIKMMGLPDKDYERYKSDESFKTAADSAMTAVKNCSPLAFLPDNKYEEWKDMIITFDPSSKPQP